MRSLLLIITIIVGFSTPIRAIEIGQAAPTFIAKDIKGNPIDLSNMRGKVVLVHFWATWCSSCREEMPVLDAFYKHYHDKGVELVAISLDKPRSREKVEGYMKNFHFSAVMPDDVEANDFEAPEALPVTYVINKQGIINAIFTPEKKMLSEQLLSKSVLPLIP
jgi:cytochrome c biogenesis protein CcmG, thiol:disulfide interchange protein DsbE